MRTPVPEPAMPTSRRVVLITGAARRIGAAIARRLHADGYDVALHYRDSAADMHGLVDELEAGRQGSTLMLQADLAVFDRLPELVARTVGHFGRLDALVNNASAFYPTPVGGATPAQWEELFAVNARAPFFLAQAAARLLAPLPPSSCRQLMLLHKLRWRPAMQPVLLQLRRLMLLRLQRRQRLKRLAPLLRRHRHLLPHRVKSQSHLLQ